MSQTSIERLRVYLAQLPPKAQALLMREFERAIERGEDLAVANFVLEQLRAVVRAPSEDITPRTADPMRLAFHPLEPFLVESTGGDIRQGQIRRTSLVPVWNWLGRDAMPDKIRAFEASLAQSAGVPNAPGVETAVRRVQFEACNAITEAISLGSRDSRVLGRLGAPSVVEDIGSICAVLKAREALDTLSVRLPGYVREFAESQVRSVTGSLNLPLLQNAQTLPFALSIIMQRLDAPWQIVRLAISVAGSDDEIRIASTPFGVAVTMAISELSRISAELRADIRRGQFKKISDLLKTLHDGLRGLRTEIDFRADSNWGRQIANIRADISNGLKSDIDSVPGRVRRLLRQGPDKDVTVNSRVDQTEVEETAAMIDFVATCRNYAGELAINEMTLRSFTDLQQYVENATESLVESLRTRDPKVLAYRKAQMQAAVRFCNVMFGPDYATLMRKAAEMAQTVERKGSRAG